MAQKVGTAIKDQAFLLRSVNYGEDHRILHWLSAEHGRVHVMAYAARSSRTRAFNAIDYLHHFQIEYQVAGGLARLLTCEPLESFENVRSDYLKTMTALQWLKLLSRLLHEGVGVPGIFDLLVLSLRSLEAQDAAFVDLSYRYWLLAKLGYQLDLARCVRCGCREASHFEFCSNEGGLVCSDCSRSDSEASVVLAQVVPESAWRLDEAISWPPQTVSKLQSLLQHAFEQLLGYRGNEVRKGG